MPDIAPQLSVRRQPTPAAAFLAEVVYYGPLAVTRATAAQLAIASTGDRRAADVFAYAKPAISLPEDQEPWPLAEAARILRIELEG